MEVGCDNIISLRITKKHHLEVDVYFPVVLNQYCAYFTFDSGGEGCIVGAAGTAMGIGSDIGGSIRLPSYFNGIFGHKATVGECVI